MSYDFQLRADALFSETVHLPALRSYIVTLPHVTATGERQCIFAAGDGRYYMEIDLEEVDTTGNAQVAPTATRVNCVKCHIPYAFFPATVDAAYNHLVLIADYLGWPVYDLQTGETWE